MKKLFVLIAACATLFTVTALAQAKPDLADTWQGTLEVGRALRLVFKTEHAAGGYKTTVYSIDQPGRGLPASQTTLDGTSVTFAIVAIDARFTGKLSADNTSIVGTWTQGGGKELPLTLSRATPATAWAIPEPPPPPKLMAADADPAFDVATIKPNNSGANSMQQLTVDGRNFATRASSLMDLIAFSYEIQARQIIGAPDWASSDRFDIDAVPDKEGAPSPEQVRLMIRKLIAERFKLTFHKDKRELSAFVLTVSKTGSKLTPTQMTGPLPGIGLHPGNGGLVMLMRNGTIGDFTGFLQGQVLDRPVVDQTGLTGKFDLNITFTPDDSQFNGHPPPIPAATDNTPTPPGFADAMQQQLGLKLEARKTPVEVLAIDHVERYSAN